MVLEHFRQFGTTKAARALLFLLILAFGAWGIESFLHAQRAGYGLSVNEEPISALELEQAYKNKLRQVEQALGSAPTPEQLQGLQLAEQVVAEAAARTVLLQNAERLQLQPATRQLQREISALPPFQNERGQFDPAQYRAALMQLNRTPMQFERDMAHDLAVRNLAQLIQLAPMPTELALTQVALQNANVVLEVATFTAQPNAATPTENQLLQFYELNPNTYEKPERRSGTVLELSTASLSGTLVIPAARVQVEYEANKAAYSVPETRKVRHILVPTQASATALQAGLTSLEAFISTANRVSTDPGNLNSKGGDLGYIKREEVVPTFGDMAFSLPVNTLSAPVQSPFGWHLIWVEDIKPAALRPLAEVRAEIEQSLRAAEAQDTLQQLVTRADELVAGGATLLEVAEKLGLKTRPLALVAADDEAVPPAVLAALFATGAKAVSTPIALEDGGVAYIQTTSIEAARTPPLADIKARVTADWRSLQSELAAQRAAESLISAARAPATGNRTLAEAARQANVAPAFTQESFTSLSTSPRWLQPRLLELAAAAPGTTLPAAIQQNGRWYVVRLLNRTLPARAQGTEAQTQVNAFGAEVRADMEALLVGYLQANATVQCEAEVLQQVFGRAVACPGGAPR